MFAALRTVFEKTLTAFVIFLLASLTVIIIMGVTYRKMGWSLVWYDEVASIMLA
ncbi:MAG: TRAP transporter small permease, partial [Oceanibaculum nanhaiense]|nr:TRAP transporter small permease [Oceanibaculum nanhaiense]